MSAGVGCGKVTQNQSDAGNGGRGGDAGDDAAGSDARLIGDATAVTEAALVGGMVGGKLGGIDVSNNSDGSMLATAKTDVCGSATIRYSPADRRLRSTRI
jgi:hypothetical protein